MIEFIIIGVILLFVVLYRSSNGESVYKFVKKQTTIAYEKYAPYSYKEMSAKIKELGLQFTKKQYLIQIIFFAGFAGLVGYFYFYNLFVAIIYAVIAVATIPYLTYLRCKRQYSEYIFEQIQVYTSNTIMEFASTQSFVKSLEGVVQSGVLEDPVLSDVKVMIALAYEKGDVYESIKYMNSKYPYYMVKNMHQLFLQITKEGARDSGQALENMSLDIDALVEGVYRDQMDRNNFHAKFLRFGLILYFLVVVLRFMLGEENYIKLLDTWYVQLILHAIVIINAYFLMTGEKYYNEDVGVE